MQQIQILSTEEKQATEELKRRIVHELTPRLLRDETLYYRFLKARDFNLKNAEEMLRKHLSDRKIFKVEENLKDYTPPPYFLKYYPLSVMGFGKCGSLVLYYDLGGIDNKGIVNIFEFIPIMQCIFNFMEKCIDLMTEQSKNGKSANQVIFVINMDKLSLSHITYRKAMTWALEAFQLFQDNYPERIKAVYILNASVYFNIGYTIIKVVLAEGLIKKIRVFGRTGWKENLLDVIDPYVLPAFLGGNKTDPDGNPFCNSFITHGKPIPEELYLKKQNKSMSEEKGVRKLTVTRSSSSEMLFNINELNTNIEWEFETKTGDIAFALCFKDNSKGGSKMEEVIPKQKIDTMLGPKSGVHKCDKIGTYVVLFDNSHSWLSSKEIYYKIRLVKPNE